VFLIVRICFGEYGVSCGTDDAEEDFGAEEVRSSIMLLFVRGERLQGDRFLSADLQQEFRLCDQVVLDLGLFGATALAGAKSVRFRFFGRTENADVFALGRSRFAGGTAEDLRGQDAVVKGAVCAFVTGDDRLPVVILHRNSPSPSGMLELL
jgi:hypothetical protein